MKKLFIVASVVATPLVASDIHNNMRAKHPFAPVGDSSPTISPRPLAETSRAIEALSLAEASSASAGPMASASMSLTSSTTPSEDPKTLFPTLCGFLEACDITSPDVARAMLTFNTPRPGSLMQDPAEAALVFSQLNTVAKKYFSDKTVRPLIVKLEAFAQRQKEEHKKIFAALTSVDSPASTTNPFEWSFGLIQGFSTLFTPEEAMLFKQRCEQDADMKKLAEIMDHLEAQRNQRMTTVMDPQDMHEMMEAITQGLKAAQQESKETAALRTQLTEQAAQIAQQAQELAALKALLEQKKDGKKD